MSSATSTVNINKPLRESGSPMSDLESAVARMFWVGFHGTTPSDDLMRLLSRGVGGVVLFARNIESPRQAAALITQMKKRAGRPLPVAIDHEGGRVMRVQSPFTQTPPMRVLGKIGDEDLVRGVGRLFARELRAVGFDMDFAPVLDVDTNADNPVIAARSFGDDAGLVTRMGLALMDGLQSAGMGACGKHFPGHGDTAEDSHKALPRVTHDMERLRGVEIPPFEAVCKAGIASVMTSHIVYEALDSDHPASMSEKIIGGLLRRGMGYGGLVISDDLEMKAITDHDGVNRAVVMATAAGTDCLLACHSAEVMHGAIDTLIEAAGKDDKLAGMIDRANRRQDAFNDTYTQGPREDPDLSVIGCDEHRRVAERMFSHAACGDEGNTACDPTDTRRWRDR
jgi:beta-N-acetylhexosaminidase